MSEQDEVRIAIEERFRDTQSSVRDAAFDLLGDYIVFRPDLAVSYLPRISERIVVSKNILQLYELMTFGKDTGLNVRKRVIKLLKRLYTIIPDQAVRSDICRKLLWRVRDDDTSIKVRSHLSGIR